MLSCKKCGAKMSGIDLVCKNCGTPWGKKHKSRAMLYFSILIILLVAVAAYIYFTPNIDKTPFIQLYTKYFSSPEKISPENTPKESSEPDISGEEIILPPTQENTPVPLPEVKNPINEEILPVEIPEILPPSFPLITASSFLNGEKGFSYKPGNTVDGLLNTAWLEGVKDNGIGEWIKYSAEAEQTLSSITLYNGYLKNNTTYVSNNRIKKFSVEFSDGTISTYDIPKLDFSKSKEGIKFSFDEAKKTDSIKVTILDIYKGSYYSDTALSGISFE